MTAHAPVLPQLTVKAIVLGLVLSAVLAGANAYLGLFAGLTVSASIPAAVISMAVLKLFKESNVLENNIVQTAASAGESLAAGVIFTMPALIMLNYWNAFDYVWVTVIAGLGGLLGVLFTIPLRRSLIVDLELAYPEGTATAEVLMIGQRIGPRGVAHGVGQGAGEPDDASAGSSADRGAKLLAVAGVVGALVKLAETGFRLWSGTAQAAAYVGRSTIAYFGSNLSPALISVGYIVGLNIAVLVFIGGAISWLVAIPIYSTWFIDADPSISADLAAGASAADLATAIWDAKIRYLGVGAMLVGGIWALVSIRHSLLAGIRAGLGKRDSVASASYDHTDHDAPMAWVLTAIAVFVVPIAVLYYAIVGTLGVALAMTVIMVVAGFLFSSVAGYMSGLVGASNNPVSGITIATILLTSLSLRVLMGDDSSAGAAAAIMVGAVVCCAAAIGSDNLQDLKAGHILGATPWRQQLMQAAGVVSAVLVMAPILNLLLAAYGIGAPTPDKPHSLLAPQATLMASVAKGVLDGGLPWGMVAGGAVIGTVIIVVDEGLKRAGSAWRAPVLAVAVGIYLPLELATPILIGGLISHLAARRNARLGERVATTRARNGLLFSAGLITGEALIGILMAIPIVIFEDADVLALNLNLPSIVGIAVIAAVVIAVYRAATAGRSSDEHDR